MIARAILAITKDNVDALPTLFKTYDTSASLEDCTIWQVARATSAATTYFKSITCGRDKIEFIDAGFGYNNPCEVLLKEARKIFPNREFACILSIGTGLGGMVGIQDSRLSILKALKNMATSSKKVADRLDELYSNTNNTNIYFRFDVSHGLEDIGLSDWKETSTISAHTRNYLEENRRRINECTKSLQTASERANTMSSSKTQSEDPGSTMILEEETLQRRGNAPSA